MRAWAKEMKDTTRLRWLQVYKFKPKIQFSIDLGPYRITTASTVNELIECFKLRHEVFFREFQGREEDGLDVDKFDSSFDHLIIYHRPSQKIIGTYRLSCFESQKRSYTALEFDLSSVFNLSGPFLELGRACIQKEHRRGSVISLLWRGIAEYMNLSNANVLFGCSSAKINNPRDAALVYSYLINQSQVSSQIYAHPTKAFQMRDFSTWLNYFARGLSYDQQSEADSLTPSLLKSYLKLGAKIAAPPAFDVDFDCIDFLTVLKKEDLGESLARRLQVVK